MNLQAKFYNRSVADTGIDGEGLSATASGATSRGANGEGALFDGSNDYALSDSWSLGGAFSMEAYVKLDSLPSHFAPIFNFAETPTVWDSVSYCGFVTSWSAASYSSCDLGQSTSYPQGCTMANCADIDDCIDECNSCGSLCVGGDICPSDSAASPLTKAFVESEDAICADLAYAMETFREGYLQIWFEGVEADCIDMVVPLFLKVLDEEVLAFESDQLITQDPTRDWRFSELQNGDGDVQAFLRNVKNDAADSRSAVTKHKHMGRILEEGIFRLAAPVGAAIVHDFPVESGHRAPRFPLPARILEAARTAL